LKFNNQILRFTTLGLILGFLFPLFAFIVDFTIKDLPISIVNLTKLHKLNSLHYIIDTAPVVIALVAFLVGKKVFEKEEKAKNEIKNQADELRELNFELEKLSIIASHTENAVSIFDSNTDMEWVNDGFKNLYGYTMEEYTIKKNTKKLLGLCRNKNRRGQIRKCIEEKVTVSYDVPKDIKNGKKIWIRRTLTPYIDNIGNVKKYIAIDSDIDELKKQSEEISFQKQMLEKQNLQMTVQRDIVKEMNEKIEEQNKKFTDSVNYASSIQKAVLPLHKDIQKCFERAFIIYKPKDIVSGDFYWFNKIITKDEQFSILIVADCTGHGIPGAFMSLIGVRLLNGIIKQKGEYNPRKILDLLDERLIEALKQKDTQNTDGMDVAICRFEGHEENKIKVTYAGAKMPIYYIKRKQGLIKKVKATRKSIGGPKGRMNKEEFFNTEIILDRKDLLYLASDGLRDQNNNKREKFSSQRMEHLLESHNNRTPAKQKQVLNTALKDWKGDEPQRDDITVIGVCL